MKIVVVGAGISGLSFALSLKNAPNGKDFEMIILEKRPRSIRDSEVNKKKYDYTLSLRKDTGGISVIQHLGLFEKLQSLRSNVFGFVFGYLGNQKLVTSIDLSTAGDPEDELRVSRTKLWETLEEQVQKIAVEIKWNSTVTQVNQSDKFAEIFYTDGQGNQQSIKADLLVAADGHESVVRQQVTCDTPLYLQTYSVQLRTKYARTIPGITEKHGIYRGKGVGLSFVDEGKGNYYFGLSNSTDEDEETVSRRLARKEELKKEGILLSALFPEPLPSIVKNTSEDSFSLLMFRDKLPPKQALKHIVFIGDAAHIISPLACSGANYAFVDAEFLSFALAKHQGNLGYALPEFLEASANFCERMIVDQRRLIGVIHSYSPASDFVNNCVMSLLSAFIYHPKKTCLTIGVVGILAFYFARSFFKMIRR